MGNQFSALNAKFDKLKKATVPSRINTDESDLDFSLTYESEHFEAEEQQENTDLSPDKMGATQVEENKKTRKIVSRHYYKVGVVTVFEQPSHQISNFLHLLQNNS